MCYIQSCLQKQEIFVLYNEEKKPIIYLNAKTGRILKEIQVQQLERIDFFQCPELNKILLLHLPENHCIYNLYWTH
jgi:hypothetical protein